ncbi:MAG: response regulator [Victivallaceae bacterium]|nr:response regulator [Victivallaceae bacterium]
MFKNNRILIVDDQEDLREQLAKLLISSGQPNKTSTLVQSMRERLMGFDDDEKQSPPPKTAPQYDIDTAGQGEEAFEMVQAAIKNGAPYAVIFTDMRMPPGWDGLKTAKKIREIDKYIEIVIMTAYADHTQSTIAQEIGMPEKLLYIKKPFQTEEIFQLAMSLTAKWSSEYLERMRRSWLEKTLVCMRTARHQHKDIDTYVATLNSFLTFLGSDKGIIAEWDADGKWILKGARNVDAETAREFFTKNTAQLLKNNAIQNNVNGVYVIPLKSNECSVIIGIYDAKTQADSEWYKLLNMLLITSVESMENASIKAKDYCRINKDCRFPLLVKEMRSHLKKLQESHKANETIQNFLKEIDNAIETVKKTAESS